MKEIVIRLTVMGTPVIIIGFATWMIWALMANFLNGLSYVLSNTSRLSNLSKRLTVDDIELLEKILKRLRESQEFGRELDTMKWPERQRTGVNSLSSYIPGVKCSDVSTSPQSASQPLSRALSSTNSPSRGFSPLRFLLRILVGG
jgi:hypothetical protein